MQRFILVLHLNNTYLVEPLITSIMRNVYLHIVTILSLFAIIVLTGCTPSKHDDTEITPPEPEDEKLAVLIEAVEILGGNITMKFLPQSDVVSYTIGIADYEDTEAFDAFESGTLPGIVSFEDGEERTYTFEMKFGMAYNVFARGRGNSGNKGETTTMAATTYGDAYGLNVINEYVSANKGVVRFQPGGKVREFIALGVPKDAWDDEYGATEAEQIANLEMLAAFGIAFTGGDMAVSHEMMLDGFPNERYVIGCVTYDADNTARLFMYGLNAPDVDPSAPTPSGLTATLKGTTSNSATFDITMGQNTEAFFYSIFTQEGYDSFPNEQAIIDDVANYGVIEISNFVNEEIPYLSAASAYVLAAVPANQNGVRGLGALLIYPFETPSASGVSVPTPANMPPMKFLQGSRALMSKSANR
jgi:hypothetical protein